MPDLHDWGTGEAPQPTHPTYVPKVRLYPHTLDDLMQRAGPYSDAVKAHVEWSAVTAWMMTGQADKLLDTISLSSAVANLSVFLTSGAEERELGWPSLSGIIAPLALYGYSPDSQCEARRVAAEVHALWEANGRPHLTADRCKATFQYLVACIRKGIIPPVRSMGDIDPNPPAIPAKPHALNMFKETP
jgi:hypothetical protein